MASTWGIGYPNGGLDELRYLRDRHSMRPGVTENLHRSFICLPHCVNYRCAQRKMLYIPYVIDLGDFNEHCR